MPKIQALITITILLLANMSAQAAHKYLEKEYENKWCSNNKGVQEFYLLDKTRVDCLLPNYAVEIEFAPKWAESTGQSLYYALKTGKQPGIVLILEKSSDKKYLTRLQALADKYNIKLWTVGPEYLK